MLKKLIVAILAAISLTFSVHVVQAGDIAITTTALSAASLSKTMRATEGNINLSMSAILACIPLSLNEARDEIYYSRPGEDPFNSTVSRAYYQYRTQNFPLEYLIISNSNQASQSYAYRMSNWEATDSVLPEARNYTQVTATQRASRNANLFFTIDANLHMVTNNPLTGDYYGYYEGWGPLEFPYQNGSSYEQISNKVESGSFTPITSQLDVSIGDQGYGVISQNDKLIYYIRCRNMTEKQYQDTNGVKQVFADKLRLGNGQDRFKF